MSEIHASDAAEAGDHDVETYATRKAVAEGRAILLAGIPSKHTEKYDIKCREISDYVLSYDSANPYGDDDVSDDADYDPRAEFSSEHISGLESSAAEADVEELNEVEAESQLSPLDQLNVTVADVQGDVQEVRGDVRNLATALGTSRESGGRIIDLSRVLDKPTPFTGAEYNVKKFNDWVLKVTEYVDILEISPLKRVGVAASYLAGDALAWWHRRKELLVRNGSDVTNMTIFLDALRERFSFRDPEQAARTALRNHMQGRSVTEYINSFENHYSYLSSWDEAEKIDKSSRPTHVCANTV